MTNPFLFFKINVNDIIGNLYGKIVVDMYHHSEKDKWGDIVHYYLCHCNCGNPDSFLVSRNDLFRGRKKSCGCLKHEPYGLAGPKPWQDTHGLNKTRFYNIWSGIHKRCADKNCTIYPYYGGRGITFDFRWLSFPGFYNEMYESYIKHCEEFGESDTTLDRIDPDDNYYLENCRWATRKEQANNTRRTIRVNYKDNQYTLRDLLDNFPHHKDVTYNILHSRIVKGGWNIDKALNTPLQ